MDQKDVYSPPAAELVNAQEGIKDDLADRGSRFGAAMIDGVLYLLVFFPALYFTDYWQNAMEGNISLVETAMVMVFGFAVFLAMHGYLLAKHGQTIGKKLLGIKIVSVESGQLVPFAKLFFTRYVSVNMISYIPLVGAFFPLVNVMFIFRKDRRCIHDLIAGTSVVRVSEG